MKRYRASKVDCDACSLKPQCCPNTPARKIRRSIHKGARDMARDIATTEAYDVSRRQRKKIEMLKLLAGRAGVGIGLMIVGELGPAECAVASLRLIEDRDVRLDPALMHQPGEVLGRAVGTVGGEPCRPEPEPILRSCDHGAGRPTSACRMARLASTSTMTAWSRSIR